MLKSLWPSMHRLKGWERLFAFLELCLVHLLWSFFAQVIMMTHILEMIADNFSLCTLLLADMGDLLSFGSLSSSCRERVGMRWEAVLPRSCLLLGGISGKSEALQRNCAREPLHLWMCAEYSRRELGNWLLTCVCFGACLECLFHLLSCFLDAFTAFVWFYCAFLWLLSSYTVLHIIGAFSQASQFCKTWLEIVQHKIQGEVSRARDFGCWAGVSIKRSDE